MAKTFCIESDRDRLKNTLLRQFQSGNINFLLGSGASAPAIPISGNVEKEIETLIVDGKLDAAKKKVYEFLKSVQNPNNELIDHSQSLSGAGLPARLPGTNILLVKKSYQQFLGALEQILLRRKTTLLPKLANIFTTNYDLFVEDLANNFPRLNINDGFKRGPTLGQRFVFSNQHFFNTTFNTGALYAHRVEVPTVNLIKLHGSLSWKKGAEEILYEILQRPELAAGADAKTIVDYVDGFSVILPQRDKFSRTTLEHVYYDLLRIYANELEKVNTIQISFGFSFEDDHIYDITRRALRNPTLKLMVFCHQKDDVSRLQLRFENHNNVDLVAPPDGHTIGFDQFNLLLVEMFKL